MDVFFGLFCTGHIIQRPSLLGGFDDKDCGFIKLRFEGRPSPSNPQEPSVSRQTVYRDCAAGCAAGVGFVVGV